MWRRPQEPDRQEAPAWEQSAADAGHRVLIEHPDPAAQDVLARGLQQHGYEVLTCGGPRAAGRTEVSCPLLRQEACGAVEGADVIVSGLSPHTSTERLIIRRLSQGHGTGQLVLEATPDEAAGLLDAPTDGHVTPLTVAGVVDALERMPR